MCRTSAIEKDLPSFDERPSLIAVNGLDNSASSSERSRSPSPTMDMPSYSVSEVNLANRNSNPFGYTNSGALDTATTNSLNDFYPSVSVSDDSKQSISQILKEANSINNSVVNHQVEVKPKVRVRRRGFGYLGFWFAGCGGHARNRGAEQRNSEATPQVGEAAGEELYRVV